jgi:coatomer subunit beta'
VNEYKSKAQDEAPDDGIDEAFSIDAETNETVVTGTWLKSCFFYLTSQNKLNYIVSDKPVSYAFLEKPSQILGYMQTQGCLFFVDGSNKIVSYEIPAAFYSAVSYAAAEDYESMRGQLAKLENDKYHDRVARFLEVTNNLEEALSVVKNQELKFEYAIKLENIDEAYRIAIESGLPAALKQIGDLCLVKGHFDKAESSFKKSGDLASLLLMYSSLGMPMFD